jgi:hypothetical protein
LVAERCNIGADRANGMTLRLFLAGPAAAEAAFAAWRRRETGRAKWRNAAQPDFRPGAESRRDRRRA